MLMKSDLISVDVDSPRILYILYLNLFGVYQDDTSSMYCLSPSQCTSGLQTAHILEPLCGYASLKPGEMFGDRRSLLENFFLVREPTDLDLGCRVACPTSILLVLL